jgi:glycolate oxidase FAD binding subunit
MNQLDPGNLTHRFGALSTGNQVRLPTPAEARAARIVIEPASPAEIAEIIRICEGDGLSLAALGASRTLSQIRREPVAIGISLVRMNRIIDYQPGDMTIVAEAGLTLEAINAFAGTHDQRLPCDPQTPQATTLGALVAAAKSGPLRLSEGTPRDLLIGVRFVGHGGRLVHGGGRVVKNVAGYDLMKVMTGSFGTLAVIYETTFKIRPVPENYSLGLASFDSTADAFAAASRAEQAASLIHLEVVSSQFGGLFGRAGRSVVLTGFGGMRAEADYYHARISNALRHTTQVLKADEAVACYRRLRDIDLDDAALTAQLAVAPSQLALCLKSCGAEFRAHAANGVAQIFIPSDRPTADALTAVAQWREVAHTAGGNLRLVRAREDLREELTMFDQPAEPAMRLMRKLKSAFDPHNVFNPGCFVGGF